MRELVLQERERIVDAVHASVLQDLFAVGLMLGDIDTGSVHIEQAADLVQRTIAELRTLVVPATTWGADSRPLDGGGSGKELADILERVSVEARADQTERLHLRAELSASRDRVAAFEAKKHFRLGYSHLMAAALGVASRSLEEHLALESATEQIRVQLGTATRVLADAAASIRATGSAGVDRWSFDLAALASGVVEQGGRFFGFIASLELAGPLAGVSSQIGYELLAALAELLADLGAEARADHVGVSISVTRASVTLRIVDNGPTTRTRLGGTLQETLSGRIGPLGGTLEVRPRRFSGSAVTWQAPLDAPS